jgi:hypothetical protein
MPLIELDPGLRRRGLVRLGLEVMNIGRVGEELAHALGDMDQGIGVRRSGLQQENASFRIA